MRARCPNCSEFVDADAEKCSACGASFVSTAWKPIVNPQGGIAHAAVCPNCSNPVEPDAEKCVICGALFGSGAAWKPIPIEGLEAYPVEFTGAAGQYFRIWIVNLVLTILTLGIYSAWAKVRKRRYFHSHTRIAGEGFEYRGRPIAILKGRAIAVVAFAAFYGTAKFAPTFLWALAIVAVIAAPWLIVRSVAFNAYNTAYRNIRLHFRGTYLQCLGVVVANGLLLIVSFGLTYPYFKSRLMQFLFRNHGYGTTQFEVPTLKYFGIYVRAIGLGFVVGICAAFVGGAFGSVVHEARTVAIVRTIVGYIGYLYIFAYVRARLANATWNFVRVGKVRFECALRPDDLFKLYLVNIIAIIATLGLATPWAVIRAMRYRAEKMTVLAEGGLDSFVAHESAEVNAAGEEIGEMFDLDLSL